MSLDVDGFSGEIESKEVVIHVSKDHRLLKLARNLPWEEMLQTIIPDLKRTERCCWWMGRPLRVRIHLGVYLLQQMFNLTDRIVEQQVRDNAAFRLFCGYGQIKKWHAPDHTKIEEFRSRLSAETQRMLANLMSKQAAKLGYATPSELDIDSTVQEANITYPAIANLLVKVAFLAATLGQVLNQLCHEGLQQHKVELSYLKQLALYYFNLKRKGENEGILSVVLKRLWQDTYAQVLPIMNNLYKLCNKITAGKYWPIRRALEKLRWRGALLLQNTHAYIFEGIKDVSILSLHAYSVACFNKGKLNKKLEFGRAYQLGRIGGNFLFASYGASLHMPDAQSLPMLLYTHESLFGKGKLGSIATDKNYYSFNNEQLLKQMGVRDIHLPRPERTLDAPPPTTSWAIRKQLHNRRAGIEALISHAKHGGQLGKSRMKSDETTQSAGFAAVLSFNLRQLTRYLAGEVRPKSEDPVKIKASELIINQKPRMIT